jgi:flagellar hook-associated protein 3 FlgL
MSTSSFSRLGSANTYDNAVHNLSVRQSSLSALQESLTSGKKVVRPSDDPTSASQAERALTRISRIATDQRALESQRNAIAVAESTLGDVNDALQTFRELVVSAGNGTHTAADRKTIALQLSGLRDQIFALANRSDTNGQPLFNALGSALAPFVGPTAQAQDYTFNGLPGQSASSEVGIPFALDGESAFMLEPIRDKAYNLSVGPTPPNPLLFTDSVVATDISLITGSSYTISNIAIVAGTGPALGTNSASYTITETLSDGTVLAPSTTGTGPIYPATSTKIPITLPGLTFNISGTPGAGDSITIDPSVSLFSVLDDAIRDIGTASSNAAASQAVSQALHNIDIGSDRVAAIRGQAGELLNRADRISSDQDKRSIQNETDRSRAEDLDMIKGISDFQNQQTGYQAALQSYAQIQKLSLFNFIG